MSLCSRYRFRKASRKNRRYSAPVIRAMSSRQAAMLCQVIYSSHFQVPTAITSSALEEK